MNAKLKPPDPLIERPAKELAQVSLRVKLTLYEMVPFRLYSAVPYRREVLEAENSAAFGVIEEPMSIIKAMASSVTRVKYALGLPLWKEVLHELRESPLTSAILHVLWAYAMLISPVWKLPGILLVVLCIVIAQVSHTGKKFRLKDPPLLYKDEQKDEGNSLSFAERHKKNVTGVIQIELGIIEFAKKLAAFASALEKIKYVLMLCDPYLSLLFGMYLLGLIFLTTLGFAVFLFIFGSFGAPLFIWVYGCFWFLPSSARQKLKDWYNAYEEWSVRMFGHGTLPEVLSSIWGRIPDANEAQHCEMFQRYSMVQ